MVGYVALHDSESGGPKESHALADLNRFLALIAAQDDRAIVLALATFIEETLGRLLLAYFRDCDVTRKLVNGFNAPLGSLGVRIKATYAFGLTTEDQYKDLEILRKVRNRFAHNWEGVSFADQNIRSLIDQLSGYTVDHMPIKGGAREKLLGTISTCCIELQIFLVRMEAGKTARFSDVSHRLTNRKPEHRS